MATDNGIHEQISALVAEEKRLRQERESGSLGAEETTARLRDLEIQLDQCWDLLRQRDALRTAGEDPDAAAIRPGHEVEGYLQ